MSRTGLPRFCQKCAGDGPDDQASQQRAHQNPQSADGRVARVSFAGRSAGGGPGGDLQVARVGTEFPGPTHARETRQYRHATCWILCLWRGPVMGRGLPFIKEKPMRTCVLAMILGLVGTAGAVSGATLSITPSSTSNTYGGVLTLQIGGLTNGEQVVIERYLDLNTNGVEDAGEVLLDTFRIADGGVNTIGGVTNVNVPYDSNPASGAITTTLNLAPSLEKFGQQ